jgi:hypothetical protein
MWRISDHLTAIGVTSAIAYFAVARSAHRRSTLPQRLPSFTSAFNAVNGDKLR